MTYLQGVVLGVVQGLTEFLPVSSSGHLILVPIVFGWPDQGLAFDAVMHLGTLAALLAYFRRELVALVTGELSRGLGARIFVATVPGALVGVALGKRGWPTGARSAPPTARAIRSSGSAGVRGS